MCRRRVSWSAANGGAAPAYVLRGSLCRHRAVQRAADRYATRSRNSWRVIVFSKPSGMIEVLCGCDRAICAAGIMMSFPWASAYVRWPDASSPTASSLTSTPENTVPSVRSIV